MGRLDLNELQTLHSTNHSENPKMLVIMGIKGITIKKTKMKHGSWMKLEKGSIQATGKNLARLWSTTKEQWKGNQKAVLATA